MNREDSAILEQLLEISLRIGKFNEDSDVESELLPLIDQREALICKLEQIESLDSDLASMVEKFLALDQENMVLLNKIKDRLSEKLEQIARLNRTAIAYLEGEKLPNPSVFDFKR